MLIRIVLFRLALGKLLLNSIYKVENLDENSWKIRIEVKKGLCLCGCFKVVHIKMNRLLLFSLISIYPLFVFCQDPSVSLNTNKMTENDSLYLIAIEKFTIEIDSFYNKYGDKYFEDKLYIAYNDYLTNLPDTINGYKIILLSLSNRKKHFKQNKNELRYIKITPLTVENGKFKITLTPYFAELKKRKHLLLGLSSWTRIYFEYKNERLKYDFSKNGGI